MNTNIENLFFNAKHGGYIAVVGPSIYHVHLGSSKTKMEALISLDFAQPPIQKAFFKAYGPPIVIAGCEWLCRYIESEAFLNFEPIPVIKAQLAAFFEISLNDAALIFLTTLYEKVVIELRGVKS